MIKYSKCVTAALLLCGAAAMAVPAEYAGAELKKVMALSNVVLQPSDDALVFKARANNKSAIYQQKLNWKTTEIKQVIIEKRIEIHAVIDNDHLRDTRCVRRNSGSDKIHLYLLWG